MFQGMAPGVAPVIKDLASEDVASHAPFVAAIFGFEPIMTDQIVKIRNLLSGMIEHRRSGPQ